jgi:alpha-D-ribose 1-methylphosphonate 5-triphosphate diphosphatase
MNHELILTNARLVTRHDTFPGTVRAVGGTITDVDRGRTAVAGGIDCEADYVVPGLVELHADGVERYFAPRPGVRWPGLAAVAAHDAECAGAGITTVCNALTVGAAAEDGVRHLREMAGAVKRAVQLGLLRADHFLHLRCEVSCRRVLELLPSVADEPLVRLGSVVAHAPRRRRSFEVAGWRDLDQGPFGLRDGAMAAAVARRTEDHQGDAELRRAVVGALCRTRGLPLASHDDATAQHVEEAVQAGATISEFPTTVEAARAARGHGLAVVVGAPNLVRGASHCGNVAARRLAEQGLVDILSSDYYPMSLLHAAWLLHRDEPGFPLAEAMATVTAAPARRVGLDDRGEIAPGQRADLVRFRDATELPVVRGVWRRGERVA